MDGVALQSGNLIANQDLSSAYWAKAGYTVLTAPGTIEETGTTGSHTFGLTTPIARAAGVGVFTHSVDLIPRGAAPRWIGVGLFSTGLGAGATQFFDCSDGTFGSGSGYGGFTLADSSMIPAPGGGWRCSITALCGGAQAGLVALDQATNPLGTFSYLGDPAEGYIVSNLELFDVTPGSGVAATPVVIMGSGAVYAGPATPHVIVSSGPVLPGKPIPVMVVTGRPVLAGPATPMMVVAGPPLPGPATPVS